MNNTHPKHPSQGRPPASKGEDRREHILASALTLFAGQGIAGTTVAQIAKASGVTSAMVHYYFNNREGLLDSLVIERLAPVLKYVWAGVSDEELSDPRQIVIAFVDRLLESVEKMPELPLLWSREILNAGGRLRERILPLLPLEKSVKVLSAFTEAQQKQQINAEVAPGLILTSVMAVVMLPLAAQTFLDKMPMVPTFDKEILRQHALALLLDGLSPKGLSGGQG